MWNSKLINVSTQNVIFYKGVKKYEIYLANIVFILCRNNYVYSFSHSVVTTYRLGDEN